MNCTQYVVVYEELGDFYFLEDSSSARFVTWLPVSNLYATIELAWWGLYEAIDYGLKNGIQIVGVRAKDIDVITDHSHPLFYIGYHNIVPVKLELQVDGKVNASRHLKGMYD